MRFPAIERDFAVARHSLWLGEDSVSGGARCALPGGADGEAIMDQAKMKVAYVITERNEKQFWNRIGVGFTNKDGSINVKLDAVPVTGQLQIRDYEPRDESDPARRAPRPVLPAEQVL
jgi:hypothetical protein